MNISRAGLYLLSLAAFAPAAEADSIFKGTVLEGPANQVGDWTGTNDLQRKAGLANGQGAIADFFEEAKKDARPLINVTATLNCPGCVAAAAVIGHDEAARTALFQTGLVVSAAQVSPALGLTTIVLLGADRHSGEVGAEQLTVAANNAPSPNLHAAGGRLNPKNLAADCIGRDKNSRNIFALFTNPPPNLSNFVDGDIINFTAPPCKAIVAKGASSLTSARVKKRGGNPISMTSPRFQYVMIGNLIRVC